MDNPIKIIHKFKNKNRKIQYNVLIFVGSILNEQTNKILLKIKDKNLYDSLIELNTREIEILTNTYDIKWYEKFFISKHILHTFKIIKQTESKIEEIKKKYGEEWYTQNIIDYIIPTKTIYSFQTTFKFEKDIKIKQITKSKIVDTSEEISFKLDNQSKSDTEIINDVSNRILLEKSMQKYESIDVDSYNTNSININSSSSDNYSRLTTSSSYTNTESTDEAEAESEQDLIDLNDINIGTEPITNNIDEYDIEELEELSKESIVINKDADNINNTLQQIIEKTDIEKSNKKTNKIIEWDKSKDNNMFDDDLINIYSKIYIYNQYISTDDTIKIIKHKICCGYEKSEYFDKGASYFIPSRLYLWSNYSYSDMTDTIKYDKVMIGQKWTKRTEILELDVEPNENLRNYEILKGNLKNLQENIKKYASAIKFENDEQNILSEYSDYITNNEIYMIDIYNELGKDYKISQDNLKNLYDVYIKIYYIGITFDDLKNIIDYLNINTSSVDTLTSNAEHNKIIQIYKTINNDLIMENEIMKTIEELKKTPNLYSNIFKENFITQSVIHINIKHQNFKNSSKIELFRIFDNYITEEKYPFIQFQTPDGKLIFKYYSLDEENTKNKIASKWFENAPYGISFKIRVNQKGSDNKFIAVNINENGRIDYKIQWKEEDQATIEDIKFSYDEVRNLLKKINKENTKLKLEIPLDHKFKFAFINTIQQFDLPEKFTISHNDLSDFSRYFFPYVAVVIDPRKRQSKVLKKNDKSKYGTYLRYKRISKYENETSLEKRIIYFLKNYEFNEKLLSIEISKQFNITEKQAIDKIQYVIEKFPNLKKSRNILKRFENLPKYKPPGIGIDIQGKQRNNYKMKISGTRSQQQLDEIIRFMNILIYLYIQTYLYKNPSYTELREKLKLLINIAKRCNKVEDIIERSELATNVKQITKLDKERLAYKPEKGQNHWTRNCQNSGDKKRRRPIPYTDKNIQDMINDGYILNKTTGDYEKEITKGKKKIILKAAKIVNPNSNDTNDTVYYTCDPKTNGEYIHVGFLSRSSNPYGLCMPCCFKKDPAISKNKEKKDYHMQCLGKVSTDIKAKSLVGEKLYILQDNNKIQDNRFGYLSEYLDIFLNTMLKKDKIIRNNYLTSSNNGWFFKYGSKQDDDILLSAVGNAIDMSVQTIKDKITDKLLKLENKHSIFCSLNNGDIKTQFNDIKSYIRFLHTNFEIDFNLVADILAIPGIIHDYGLNIIVFNQKKQLLLSNDDKKTMNDDFNIEYVNRENIDYLLDVNRINIIILKDDFNYYPIYQIRKKENSKTIDIDKIFKYENKDLNVINHIHKYLLTNYTQNTIINDNTTNAKIIFKTIEKHNLTKYFPTKQIVDKRNKCKYFVIMDKYLIPVKPSGALFWIPIESNYEQYLNDLNITSDILYDIYHQSNKEILIKPQGIYYTNRKNDIYNIEAIIINNFINVPISNIKLNKNNILEYAKKYKIKEIIIESKSIYDIIDKELSNNTDIIIDKRIIEANSNNFNEESYNLFRLELAYYLKDQNKLRQKFIKLLSNDKITKDNKISNIKKILYKIINKDLYDSYIKYEQTIQNTETETETDTETETKTEQSGGTTENINTDDLNMFININKKLVNISDKPININNYIIDNNREVCPTNLNKNLCNTNLHCAWKYGSCVYNTTTTNIIKYINKITDELINNSLKSSELLSIDNYFVSDIVNKDNFTERDNQKIIKSDNNNIKKILSELFGEKNIPIIGKRRINKISKNINETNIANPIEIIGNNIYQNIHFNNVIYRTYANCYFWIKNNLMSNEHRNLGYYNPYQTDLANYFKSNVIDWISNKKNQTILLEEFNNLIQINKETFIDDIKQYLSKSNENFKAYIIDLYILSKIYKYPIIVYDGFENIICILENGLKYLINNINFKNKPNLNDYNKPHINIKYNINNFTLNSTPTIIYAIYIN